MKKILFTLLICLFMIPGVNAESIIYTYDFSSQDYLQNTTFLNGLESVYIKLSEVKNDYKYYAIYIEKGTEDNQYFYTLSLFNDTSFEVEVSSYLTSYIYECYDYYYNSDIGFYNTSSGTYRHDFYNLANYKLYDSNYNFKVSDVNLEFIGFYDDNILLYPNYIFPTLKNIFNYSSWDEYNQNCTYKTVDLDDYEYVILNLKDYSSTKAFETNLPVKGSVGITPVYEFGTVEKEYVTSVCNLAYEDFTDYRFFILQNDLINNVVYIVKECNGSGSAFRYDSSLFDITYVTSENVNDPVITFGGVEYHTIPFNKLSNTVNKNEEEGYIPGESEGFDPLGSSAEYLSSFWNTLTTFMGLVTKFFYTLPIEIRAVSITMFTTAITLGVIKFIKS